MGMSDTDQDVRRVCVILESIAKNYPSDSDEALAIRDAAAAYIAVRQYEGLKNAYRRLVLASGGQLSEEMKAKLRRHGIEPEDFDDGGSAER